MAKRYDPILCMLVDEPAKAQDAMPSDLKKAGYEVGTVEKYGSTYYTLIYNGKVISTSPTEANIVEKAKKHYANRHGKAQDEILFYQLRFSSGRTEGAKLDESEIRSYAEALLEKYGEKQVAVSRQGKIVATYLNRKSYDSSSALDNAIKVCDAVEVETSKWSFSSGKSKPSGFGNWWFKIGTEEKNFSGNWSSAKAEAIKYAKEKGINRISLMT